MRKPLVLLAMLALVLAGVAAAKTDRAAVPDDDTSDGDHGRHGGRDGNATGGRASAEDDNRTGHAYGPDDNRTRGYEHAFGQMDNETKNASKTAWKEQEKGKPSWFSTLLQKVKKAQADANEDPSEDRRHRGFAEAASHVPAKVAEKFAAILDGLWGKMRQAAD